MALTPMAITPLRGVTPDREFSPPDIRLDFASRVPRTHTERLAQAREGGRRDIQIHEVFLGLAAERRDGHIDIGISTHDGMYSIDFAMLSITVKGDDSASRLADTVLYGLHKYAKEHNFKFMGAGVTAETIHICPDLASLMWLQRDIPTLVYENPKKAPSLHPYSPEVDELADSMARKCVRDFNPMKQPMLEIGFRNQVDVDVSGRCQLATLEDYRRTVGNTTWVATLHFAERLKERNIKIAFFNSTPQGGGVALMRHALVRFLWVLGVKVQWFVPKPSPQVFRITKTNHNILQGVSDPSENLSMMQRHTIRNWVHSNAERFWLSTKGPLASRADGGSDIIIVDDPQMPYLVPLAKKADPTRPVLYRSHIQVRADLVDEHPESPTANVFGWLWECAQEADLFISHPVKQFVPKVVDRDKVAYMPATTDWLDGLNKEMKSYDTRFYLHNYNIECHHAIQPQLAFPERPYIVQIARFDPSKGIDTVVKAYGTLRRKYLTANTPKSQIPQLVIAGHSAIDDPDASLIFDSITNLINEEYPDIAEDISMRRLGPVDQELNMLMSCAKVALQLSTREGFEVKVSEALHKGLPIIATRAGGIPLQIEDGKSGFLVEPNDHEEVAKRLYELFSDEELYSEMSEYAASHVSDEVGTVGGALCWMYLADRMTDTSEEKPLKPACRWVNDLAREKAGVPYQEDEPRLPRHLSTE